MDARDIYPRYFPEGLSQCPEVEGYCDPEWESVRASFAANFRENRERGGAVCVYHRGRKVVDLWAGEKALGVPWTEDTLTNVFSMGKGLAALGLALLHSQGHLNYDEKVSTYWPAFGCKGKESTTVRELLSHQTGVCAVEEPLTDEIIRDPAKLEKALAETKMEFTPKEGNNGYMAITMGWYVDMLCRHADPKHRGIDQFLREEATAKLGCAEEVYCGLPPPSQLDRKRLASLNAFCHFDMALRGKFSSDFIKNFLFQPSSYAARAFKNPQLLGKPTSYATEQVRTLSIPGANFHTTARGAARLYDAILQGELGFSSATLAAVAAPIDERFDVVLRQPTALSLGFMKPCPTTSFGSSDRCFGTPGTGGQLAFADPDAEVAYAYITNRLGLHMMCDPRELALRQAIYKNLARLGFKSREQHPDALLQNHMKAGTVAETSCLDPILRPLGGFLQRLC